MRQHIIKDIKYSIAISNVEGYKCVDVTFLYDDKVTKRYVYIKKGQNVDYIKEAKKIINQEQQSGQLIVNAKKYHRRSYKKPILITLITVCIAMLLAVAGFYTYKFFTTNNSGGGGGGGGDTTYYTVDFDTNGGSPKVKSQEVEEGGYATDPKVKLIRDEGETFQYWSLQDEDEENPTKFVFETTKITANTTLHAIYNVGPIISKVCDFDFVGVGCVADGHNIEYKTGETVSLNIKANQGFKLRDHISVEIGGEEAVEGKDYKYTLSGIEDALFTIVVQDDTYIRVLTDPISSTGSPPMLELTYLVGSEDEDITQTIKLNIDFNEDENVYVDWGEGAGKEQLQGSGMHQHDYTVTSETTFNIKFYGNINSINDCEVDYYDGKRSNYNCFTYDNRFITGVTWHNNFVDPHSCSSLGGRYVTYNATDYSKLTNLTIENSVTYIPSYMFYSCPLSSLNLPESIETVGDCAFCYSLTYLGAEASSDYTVKLPSSIKHVGAEAFSTRNGDTTLFYPILYTALEKQPDGYNPEWTDLPILWNHTGSNAPQFGSSSEPNEWYYCYNNNNEALLLRVDDISLSPHLVIPETIDGKVVKYLGNNCKTDPVTTASLSSLTLPSTLQYIYWLAFYNVQVNAINFSATSNLEGIFSFAFESAKFNQNETINLPESLKFVGKGAFYHIRCSLHGADSSIQSVYIPSSLSYIGPGAFNVYDDGSNTFAFEISEDNPYYTTNDEANIVYDTRTDTLLVGFSDCVIPEGTKIIGGRAFASCYLGKDEGVPKFNDTLIIPSSVEKISESAFCGTRFCPVDEINSEEIHFDSDSALTYIGDYAFESSSLHSFKVPKKVRYIGSYALSYLLRDPDSEYYYSLDELEFDVENSQLTIIGEYAFSGPSQKAQNFVFPSSLSNAAFVGRYIFGGIGSNSNISVPKQNANWNPKWKEACNAEITIRS